MICRMFQDVVSSIVQALCEIHKLQADLTLPGSFTQSQSVHQMLPSITTTLLRP